MRLGGQSNHSAPDEKFLRLHCRFVEAGKGYGLKFDISYNLLFDLMSGIADATTPAAQ